MTTLAMSTFFGLLALGLFQAVTALLTVIQTRPKPCPKIADEKLPKAAILLALRGADPDLAESLQLLMQQDYPCYEFHIVVDCEQDPAWKVVEQAISDTGAENVVVRPLTVRPDDCSLQCASAWQLANALDDTFEVIALADSDMVAHKTWLRELVAPIIAGEAGATNGNRWYWPQQGRLGSLIRFAWNSAAVPSMYWNGVPWGGTFSGRVSDFHRSRLVDQWKRAMAVDAPITNAWKKIGVDIKLVPSLLIINREECGVADCFGFLCRQLLWTRLYQPTPFWWMIVCHGIGSVALFSLAVGLAIAGLAVGDMSMFIWNAAGVGAYTIALVLLTGLLEFHVRSIVRIRGESTSWLSGASLLKMPLAILMAQYLHCGAILTTFFQNKVKWRGVTYLIRAPFDVKLMADGPFETPKDSSASL